MILPVVLPTQYVLDALDHADAHPHEMDCETPIKCTVLEMVYQRLQGDQLPLAMEDVDGGKH